jgi:hypothetical protein
MHPRLLPFSSLLESTLCAATDTFTDTDTCPPRSRAQAKRVGVFVAEIG